MRFQRFGQIDSGALCFRNRFPVYHSSGKAFRRSWVAKAARTVRSVRVNRADYDLFASGNSCCRGNAVFLIPAADAALQTNRHNVLSGGHQNNRSPERLAGALRAKCDCGIDKSRFPCLSLRVFRKHNALHPKRFGAFPNSRIYGGILEYETEKSASEVLIFRNHHVFIRIAAS